MRSRGRGTGAGTHLPPCPIVLLATYLSFGKSDVIHGTILAFAQRPTWPTLGGCLRLAVSRGTALGAIRRRITASRCSSPTLSWRRSVTALRHGYARNAPRSALGYFYYE